MTIVMVTLSCKNFSNFSRIIHLTQFESMSGIFKYMKMQLVATFQSERMQDLVLMADGLQLHCHDFKFISDLKKSKTSLIYLCDCA